jgi:hypothetical protein
MLVLFPLHIYIYIYIHTHIHTYRVGKEILAEKRKYEEKKQQELLAEKKYDDKIAKEFLKQQTAAQQHDVAMTARRLRGRHAQHAHHRAQIVSTAFANAVNAGVVDAKKTGVDGMATAGKVPIRALGKVAVKAKQNMDLSSWLIDEEKEAHDDLASYANV